VLVAAIVVLVVAGVWSIRTFLPREPRPPAGPTDGKAVRETIVPLDSIQALHSPASELVGVEAESIDTVATALVTGEQEEEPAREVEPPAPPEVRAAETETPATAGLTEVYGVHVSSLTSEKDAWEDSERFYARGYSVAVRGEDIPGKGHWYRVYVGPFVEKEEASRVAAEVRESGLADYTRVRRLPASLFEQPQGGVRGER
jgi:cell division septation protein DedD